MRHLTLDQIFQLPQFNLESAALLLPPSPGLYFVLEHSPKKQIVYIGKANNLQQRWKTHHRMKDLLMLEAVGSELAIAFTPGVRCYSDDLLYADEMFFIETFNPPLNNYKTPIKSKRIEEPKVITQPEPPKEGIKYPLKGAIETKVTAGPLDRSKLNLHGMYKVSKKKGWVDAHEARSWCNDLRNFTIERIEELFKLMVGCGEGAIKMKNYKSPSSGSRLVWISEPIGSLDLNVVINKLRCRGRKHGYLSFNKLKCYVWELKKYDADEVMNLFDSLCSEGTLTKRLVGDKEEFYCPDNTKRYPKVLRKQKEGCLVTS